MTKISSICVYCGSRMGTDPAYAAAADTLGKALAEQNIRLVYGGASIGMMGRIAQTVLDNGGEVTGVIPNFLTEMETPLSTVNEQILTDTMHERKQIMFDKSDAFVVMPGGIGTLEEAFEMLTWRQLSQHRKPIVFLNIKGYWDSLIALLDHIIDAGFAGENIRGYFQVVNDPEDVIATLEQAKVGVPAE